MKLEVKNMHKKVFAVTTLLITVLAIIQAAEPVAAQPNPPQIAPRLSGWNHFDHGSQVYFRNGVRYAKVWDAYSRNNCNQVRVSVRIYRWNSFRNNFRWVVSSSHWNYLTKINRLTLRKTINGHTSTMRYIPNACRYCATHKVECTR
jgi:hypothetical protein